jgi:hypothetical protein
MYLHPGAWKVTAVIGDDDLLVWNDAGGVAMGAAEVGVSLLLRQQQDGAGKQQWPRRSRPKRLSTSTTLLKTRTADRPTRPLCPILRIALAGNQCFI